jgi:hypothetical protein
MNNEIPNLSKLKRHKDPEIGLWTELVRRSHLETNPSGDVILVVESFKEPLKEILH